MGYRDSGREAAGETTKEPSESLLCIDVSGARGAPGAAGASGSHGYSSGADGAPGGDAGPAEPGQDAGALEVRIAPDGNATDKMVIEAHCRAANGDSEDVVETVAIDESGFLDLRAIGGRGGNGGKGGRGGDGATGSRGRDATRYSSGTDGGPGGDGGRGGRGSSGANGGKGGTIFVQVAEENTHLLMLVRHRNGGGAGGAPGAHGQGGSGGSGGDGGSSYSWTESESYTDSNGQRQTRTTRHSNSGGSSGPSGSSGLAGSGPLYAGQAGAEGHFAIRVKSATGTKAYSSRYDLKLIGFRHRSANEDGIYEPEEKIHVSQIQVENIGGMPTPATREVHVLLGEKGWIMPDEGHLVLPKSLGPGERYTFSTEELTCTLGAFHPSKPTDPLAEEEVIRHRARVPDAQRDFTNYENEASFALGRFMVRFPIEVSAIECLQSLGPGQASRLRFRVTNTSGRAYGARSELRRRIVVRLFLHESELDDSGFLYFDAKGNQALLSRGFEQELEELAPGQSVDIEGTIAIGEGSPFYRAGRIWLALELGAIAEPSVVRPIQYRGLEVRVSRPFKRSKPKDVLLVVNQQTTAEEMAAWEKLFGALGLSHWVYDISLEGGIDLDSDGSKVGHSLRDDLRGRTLLFLNNAIDTPNGKNLPLQYVAKPQILELAKDGGHCLVLGKAPKLASYLVPTEDLAAEDAPAPSVIHKWSWLFWGKPSEQALQQRARVMQEEHAIKHPGQRFVWVWELSVELVKDYFFFAKWKMGQVWSIRTLDQGQTSLSAASIEDQRLHDPEHVLGQDNIQSLLAALPFEEKLERLQFLGNPKTAQQASLASQVADAILADLAEEQLASLSRPWCQGRTPQSLRAALPRLRHFLQMPLAHRALMVRMVATLWFFITSQARFWEFLPPLLFERSAPVLRSVVVGLLKAWVRRAFGGTEEKPSEDARTQIKAAMGEIKAAREALAADYKKAKQEQAFTGKKADYAVMRLLGPARAAHKQSSSHALSDPEERIFPRSEYEALRAKDEARHAERRKIMGRAAEDRRALLKTESTEELLAKSKPIPLTNLDEIEQEDETIEGGARARY